MPARLPYHTIGHSTLSVDELASRLKAAGVTRLIDVRTIPRSRTNPQYEIKSDKTDHVAVHKGAALHHVAQ